MKTEPELTEEESRLVQIAWVQEALESMNKDAEESEENRTRAVEHLLTAARHYCDFYNLDFNILNASAAEVYALEVLDLYESPAN